MRHITRQGSGTLLAVEQLNPDIPAHEYAWRHEQVMKTGILTQLTADDNPDLHIITMNLTNGKRYHTGMGTMTVSDMPDGQLITLTTPNSRWKFGYLGE